MDEEGEFVADVKVEHDGVSVVMETLWFLKGGTWTKLLMTEEDAQKKSAAPP